MDRKDTFELRLLEFNPRLATAAFLSFSFLYLFLTLFRLPATPIFFENDHFIQMYDSVRMLNGEILYKDFFQFTFPGTEVWYLVLFKIFGQRIWLLNGTIGLLGLSLTWSILALSKRLMTGIYVYVAPSIFLFFGFRWYGADGGHRLFSCLFATLAILVLMGNVSRLRLVWAGFFCALATFFTQNRGIGICAAIGIFLVWELFMFRPNERFRELSSSLVIFGAAFGVSLLALIGYFLVTAGPVTFFESTILFAQSYNADPLNNSNLYLLFWQNLFRGSVNRASLPVDLFYYILVPAVYLIPPLYYFIKKPPDREMWRKVMLLCISGIFLFLVTTGLSPVRLYHVAIPGILLIALWWHKSPRRLIPLAGTCIVVVLSVALSIWGQLKSYPPPTELPTGKVVFTSDAAGDRYRWVLKHTQPGDLVFEPFRTAVNFPLMVRNPTSFAMLRNSNYTSADQVKIIIRELDANPPKYILWDGNWSSAASERAPGDHLGPLYEFLTTKYQLRQTLMPLYEFDIQVWERVGND